MAGMYPDNENLELFGEAVSWPGVDGNGKFTNGNFSNPAEPPSYIPAQTINLILDNLSELLLALGKTPNNQSTNQLALAVTAALNAEAQERTTADQNLRTAILAISPEIDNNVQTVLGVLEEIRNIIDTHKIAVTLDHPDASVVTDKIADANVTAAKLADGAVETAKIADNAITYDKFQKLPNNTLLGNNSTELADAAALTAAQARALLNVADKNTAYTLTETIIDASNLNADNYYPVTIKLSYAHNYRIEVWSATWSSSSSVPKKAWMEHGNGFTVRKIWEVTGEGWGTINNGRRILSSTYAYANADPVRGLTQVMQTSDEIVYVRGGGRYSFRCSHGVVPVLRPSGYTWTNSGESGSCPIHTSNLIPLPPIVPTLDNLILTGAPRIIDANGSSNLIAVVAAASAAKTVDLPVGSYILAKFTVPPSTYTPPNVNSVRTVRYVNASSPLHSYECNSTYGSGDTLSGTWRSCGIFYADNGVMLLRRTA